MFQDDDNPYTQQDLTLPVSHTEVHSQGSQTSITGQSECWVLVEDLQVQKDANFCCKKKTDLSIQMNTDICLHIFWTIIQDLEDKIEQITKRLFIIG